VDLTVDLARFVALGDFEPVARERMDPAAYDYVAGGSWDEISLAESVAAWRRYRVRPRVLRELHEIDVSGAFLGRRSALPVAVAPMAFQELAHPDGEAATAAAAARAGVPFILSTSSSRTIEDVAATAPDGDRWFQLYFVETFDTTRDLVSRATDAGYTTLVVTVDLPLLGYRDRDRRNRLVLPPLANAPEAYRDPETFSGPPAEERPLGITWADVDRIAGWSNLPLVLKGILTSEDARLAVDHGAKAIVVSSHGARQLDRVPAPVDVLAEIVEAVDGACEVWVDGGVRRGLDIVIAHALGASGILIGRPIYWALATGGQAGVERALLIVRDELHVALALIGVESVRDIRREHLQP
jgi:4-hydroxymandelate oxidase